MRGLVSVATNLTAGLVWFLAVQAAKRFTATGLRPIYGIVYPLMFALHPIHRKNILGLRAIWAREEPTKADPVLELISLANSIRVSLMGLVVFIPFVWVFEKPWRWLAAVLVLSLLIPALSWYLFILLAPNKPGLGRQMLGLVLDRWDKIRTRQRSLALAAQLSSDGVQISADAYRPLAVDRAEIRLVSISRDAKSSKLQYGLVTVALGDEKRCDYDAISYTWDGQERDQDLHLLVDNRPQLVKTTRNVKDMLADRAPLRGTTYLWIDALCINQEDDDEQNAQIVIMGRIYRSARRTLVWLDNILAATPEQPRPLPSDLVPMLIIFTVCRLLIKYWSNKPRKIIAYASSFVDPYFWGRLERFLKHPYWTRLWIIQEIALADQVHIHYGGQVLSMSHIYEALRILQSPAIDRAMRSVLVAPPYPRPLPIDDVISLLQTTKLVQQLGRVSLEGAMIFSFNAQCAKPCDKIYGIRALFVDDDDDASELAVLTPPRRDRSLSALFAGVTTCLLARNPDFVFERAGLGLPYHVRGGSAGAALPTWVLGPPNTGPPHHQRINLHQCETGRGRQDYSAGGAGPFTHRILPPIADGAGTGPRLSLPVVRVGTLAGVSDPFVSRPGTTLPSITGFFKSCRRTFEAAVAAEGTYVPTGQRGDEAFWRTLVGDKVRENRYDEYAFPAPERWKAQYQAWADLVVAVERGVKLGDMLSEEEVYGRFARQFIICCEGRMFGVLESGRDADRRVYFGVVPDGAAKGDAVGVVPGVKMPLVFRPFESVTKGRAAEVKTASAGVAVQLVGNCYVHGVMNGELVAQGAEAPTEEYIVH